jgi:hypothetical protein
LVLLTEELQVRVLPKEPNPIKLSFVCGLDRFPGIPLTGEHVLFFGSGLMSLNKQRHGGEARKRA